MRTMLMSFKPSVYNSPLEGIKIFEHRRSFPDEHIKAYMYVSSPVCAITGILCLGKRHNLNDWENEYSYDADAIRRIRKYEINYRYAMEILEFRETNAIKLSQLREDLDKFVVPQMYYYIDNTQLFDYLQCKLREKDNVIKHRFDNITSEQICLR